MPRQERQPVQNRVRVLLVHIPKLSIRGQARLAAEVGVSRSTISRLVNGRINPSYRLARGVTSALERMLGYPLDMRDVFSTDGTYLTPSGCGLCRCPGCLPDEAYDSEDNLHPAWRGQQPGDWSMTRPAISDAPDIPTDGCGTSGKENL
jgi:DNA-binding XRE family transcriptional regulator